MENTGKREEQPDKAEKPPKLPEKKRKKEPEVTIAPTEPGGPDISIE
jgi:hypothetical protein